MKKKLQIIKNMLSSFVRKKMGRIYFEKAIKRDKLNIVVGASGVYEKGWIPTDQEYLDLLNEKNWKKYFKENRIEAVLAEHVWEHLTLEEGVIAAKTCFEYLKKGGYVRLAVPDGFFPDEDYIENVRPNGRGAGFHDHQVLYNYKTLTLVFEKAGFKVRLLEYYDEHGVFHFEEWDQNDGMIFRSSRFDERNIDGNLKYTSIILDAVKK